MRNERPRVPLARLACAGALDAAAPVATDGTPARAWRERIAAWRSACLARPEPAIAVHVDDALEAGAALFGAWLAGKTPWLPGDRLPATLAALPAGVVTPGDPPPAAGAAPAFPVLDENACRLMLFTSGSTGDPVAVAKTLAQLDREIETLEAAFGARLGDAGVAGTVSHQHIYGLLFRLLWPLSARRPLARQRLRFHEELAALGDRPVALVASPAHLKRLPETLDWVPLASALRVVFSSGGPLPADAALAVERLWRQAPVEVFGSTETGGVAWRSGAGRAAPWQLLPGIEWRLEGGRLALRSPHLPDVGWHLTEDLAVAAADGGFELRGRADRIVKVEERRVSLDAIERRLREAPWLADLRVLALPGHRLLLAVVAVPSAEGAAVLAGEGRAALVARLRDGLAGHVDPIALPRRWRFVDALPLDAQGKAAQRRLAELFRPRVPAPDWQRRDGAIAELTLLAEPGLAGFDGHFPQAAVLPGVVLVDWALRLGREAFGLTGAVRRLDTVKFQQLVHPGQRLHLRLERLADGLGFRFDSDAGVHASGKLRFDGGGDG